MSTNCTYDLRNVICLLVCTTLLACGGERPQVRRVPQYVWSIRAVDQIELEAPRSVSVQMKGASKTVIVADPQRAALVILDGENGSVVRVVKRLDETGRGFRQPYLVATSGSGNLTAVYDLGYEAVLVLDMELQFIRQMVVDPLVVNPKDLRINDDTTIVLTGGTVRPDLVKQEVHWFWPTSGATAHTGLQLPGEASDHVGAIVAGGAIYMLDESRALVAQATTGNVFLTEPNKTLRVATGPGIGDDVLENIIHYGSGADHIKEIWWTFPKAIMIWPQEQESYMVVWAESDSGILRFIKVDGDGPADVAVWKVAATVATRFDQESLVLVGTDSLGSPLVSRMMIAH